MQPKKVQVDIRNAQNVKNEKARKTMEEELKLCGYCNEDIWINKDNFGEVYCDKCLIKREEA